MMFAYCAGAALNTIRQLYSNKTLVKSIGLGVYNIDSLTRRTQTADFV